MESSEGGGKTMLKLILPLVALLAVGGAAAGAAVYLANGGGTGEEVAPSSLAQASPTPTATLTPTPTPAVTPTPSPAPDAWTTYEDAELGFSFPHPEGLTISEDFFDLFGKGEASTVRMRALTFRDASGVRVLDLGITPNPDGLSVQEWIDTYDPCASTFNPDLPQPEGITIAGEAGILCPVDQLNQPVPRIYFRHGGHVFVLIANVHGIPESGFPPAFSETDFQRVIDEFSFGS